VRARHATHRPVRGTNTSVSGISARRGGLPRGAVAGAAVGDIPAVTVAYDDLNVDSAQGSAALYARIAAAAREVCATPDDIRDLGALATARTCERQAIARAVQAVNSPRLAAVYALHLRHG
jgi:UrcA family protein